MTQFEQDLNEPMQGAQSKGIYNLLVSKRDLSLYCVGLKPHRNWKFNDVKKYFGLTGDKHKVSEALKEMVNKAKQEIYS